MKLNNPKHPYNTDRENFIKSIEKLQEELDFKNKYFYERKILIEKTIKLPIEYRITYEYEEKIFDENENGNNSN